MGREKAKAGVRDDSVPAFGTAGSSMPIALDKTAMRRAIGNLPASRTNVFGIVVHHTDSMTADRARESLSKKNLSTHIMVDRDGLQYMEMGLQDRAAACVGFNKWMWQLDVVGRFEIERPSEVQLKGLKNILALLSCGRRIKFLDKKFSDECRKSNKHGVAKLSAGLFAGKYEELHGRAERQGGWGAILDKTPFFVAYHGEVRPTKCCGKNLICEIEGIVDSINRENGYGEH